MAVGWKCRRTELRGWKIMRERRRREMKKTNFGWRVLTKPVTVRGQKFRKLKHLILNNYLHSDKPFLHGWWTQSSGSVWNGGQQVTLCCARWIQPTPSHLISLRYLPTVFGFLCLGFPSGFFLPFKTGLNEYGWF